MKELNLEVGQKVWSIQLGDCKVESVSLEYYPILCRNENGMTETYTLNGKQQELDNSPSLFESNPFERSVDSTETIESKQECVENKAELINALLGVIFSNLKESYKDIAEDKLQKLLESI